MQRKVYRKVETTTTREFHFTHQEVLDAIAERYDLDSLGPVGKTGTRSLELTGKDLFIYRVTLIDKGEPTPVFGARKSRRVKRRR